jgi:Bacterial Ig-like domain/Family of unknown function (DUF6055)
LGRRLVLLVLCGLVLPASAAAGSPHAKREAGVRALRTAAAALDGRASKAEPTLALKELALRLPSLDPVERREARRLLARPLRSASNEPALDRSLCSAHFCIHWTDEGADAPPPASFLGGGEPDYIRTMSEVFEHVYAVENDSLHWREPRGDGTAGGDFDKVDVYVKDVGDAGIFGYSTPDPDQSGKSRTAYLVMDNDYAQEQFPRYPDYLGPMEVTAAHEYNHVLQFTYDVMQDTWFMESSAVWMEDRVYDTVDDYVSYVVPWARLTQVPLTRFNERDDYDSLNVKAYGDVVWNRWLENHFGAQLIRSAWERSTGTIPESFAPSAYDAALHARGSSFFEAFVEFAADSAEWRSAAGPFGDVEGVLWPDVARASKTTLAPGSGAVSGRLDHTAYALLDVTPTADARIKLVGTLPRGTAGAIALVGREGTPGSGPVQVATTRLRHGGAGSVTLANPGRFARITAVLVNADTSADGYSQTLADWAFEHDGAAISARVSNRFAPLQLRSTQPGSGAERVSPRARVVLRFSAPVSAASLASFRLRDADGKRVKVRVKRRGRRVTLVPRHRLDPGRRYFVELGSGVVDADGNGLAPGPRRIKFRTRRG